MRNKKLDKIQISENFRREPPKREKKAGHLSVKKRKRSIDGTRWKHRIKSYNKRMKKIEEGKLNIKNSAENIIPYHWKRLFKMRIQNVYFAIWKFPSRWSKTIFSSQKIVQSKHLLIADLYLLKYNHCWDYQKNDFQIIKSII